MLLTFLPTFVFTWKTTTDVGSAQLKLSFSVTGVWVTADCDMSLPSALNALLDKDGQDATGDKIRMRITEEQAFDVITTLTDDTCPDDMGQLTKCMGAVHCMTLCITLVWLACTFLLAQDEIKHRLVVIPFVSLLHTLLYFVTPIITADTFEKHKSDWLGGILFDDMISAEIFPSVFTVASVIVAAAACVVYIKCRWFNGGKAQ